MALIEEIFKLFDEETRLNKIQGRLSSGNLEFKSDLLVLDLIKVDGNDLLFKSGTGACRIKVDGEINLPSLQAEETSVGIDYFFWVAKTDFEATKRTVTMSYLRRGRTERKNEIDIAFGDEVMYQMKVRDKVANIPSTLSAVSRLVTSWVSIFSSKPSRIMTETSAFMVWPGFVMSVSRMESGLSLA